MKHRTGVGTTDSGARLPGVPVPAVAVSCMNGRVLQEGTGEEGAGGGSPRVLAGTTGGRTRDSRECPREKCPGGGVAEGKVSYYQREFQ